MKLFFKIVLGLIVLVGCYFLYSFLNGRFRAVVVDDYPATSEFVHRPVKGSGSLLCGIDEIVRKRDNKVITKISLCESNIEKIIYRNNILTVYVSSMQGTSINFQKKVEN